jgi:arylsulfatase A-like enzyme
MLGRRELLKYLFSTGLAGTLTGSVLLNGCDTKPERKSFRTGKPNVVIVLCDTLRPDYLGFYGFPRETAPFLAKLAKRSVVFKRAFSTSSWTAPSTASLFTSRYPHRLGVIEGMKLHKMRMERFEKEGKFVMPINRIPMDIPTLPEIFKAIGYKTFCVAANRNIEKEIGFDRGFDRFEMIGRGSAEALCKRIQSWKKEIYASPQFFVYAHFNDVHVPYDKHDLYYHKPADPADEPKAKYLSEITYLDKYIEKLYKILECDQKTIFVVLSDHGEEFLDHGSIGHGGPGRRLKLYRELTQVLMMFHAPFLQFKPRDININVSLIDVLPTLLDLIKIRKIEGMEGSSLTPILKNTEESENFVEELNNRTLFAHRNQGDPKIHTWAAIRQHWNMIEFQDHTKKLFDHRSDTKELIDVFSKNMQLTAQLTAKLEHFKKHGKRKPEILPSLKVDNELVETLKSLGYVDD